MHNQRYLGDGVYVMYAYGAFWLDLDTQDRLASRTTKIRLTPETLSELNRFKDDMFNQDDGTRED